MTNEIQDETVIAVSGTEDLDIDTLGDCINELVQELHFEALESKAKTIIVGCRGPGKAAAMAVLAGRADVVFCDDLPGLSIADIKTLKDMPAKEWKPDSGAHLNFEENQKLKTKGCRSKRRRKW